MNADEYEIEMRLIAELYSDNYWLDRAVEMKWQMVAELEAGV